LHDEHITYLLSKFNSLAIGNNGDRSLYCGVIVDVGIVVYDDVEFGRWITVVDKIVGTTGQQVVVQTIESVVVHL